MIHCTPSWSSSLWRSSNQNCACWLNLKERLNSWMPATSYHYRGRSYIHPPLPDNYQLQSSSFEAYGMVSNYNLRFWKSMMQSSIIQLKNSTTLDSMKKCKQFVQNHTIEIRMLLYNATWIHCAGKHKLADLPSIGMAPIQLTARDLWRKDQDRSKSGELSVWQGEDICLRSVYRS